MNNILADNTEAEDSVLSKYSLHAAAGADATGNLAGDLAGGVVASVVDVGTTIWNSLTPERVNASTGDLLSRIDSNAFQVYNEHPDAVKAASFIGGMFMPIGLAMKGMTYLRSGEKAVGWFSEAGRVSRLKEAETLYNNGTASAAKLKSAQRAYYAANAANLVTDMVAAQVAIDITMSAHPFMEDYQKDHAKNFLISVAFGSTLGVPLGHIIARGEITAVKMGVEKKFTSAFREATTPVEETRHAGEQFIARKQNIDNLEAHVAAAEDAANPLVLSPMTIERFKFLARQERAKLLDDFNKASSEDIQKLPAETQQFFMDILSDAKFAGVDKIGFVSLEESISMEGTAAGILQPLWNFTKAAVTKTGKATTEKTDGVYATPFKAFIGKKEAVNYTTIADTGATLESLQKTLDKTVGSLPRADAAITASVAPTGLVEKDIAQAFFVMQTKSTAELILKPIVSAPDDLATIGGYYSRLNELKSLGEDVSNAKLLITRNAPSFGAMEKIQLRRAGVNPNYLEEMRILGKEENWKKYSLYHPLEGHIGGLSIPARTLVRDWVHNFDSTTKRRVRNGALFLREEIDFVGKEYVEAEMAASAIQEIQHSKKSVAFRNEFSSRHADAEGYVYFYRGLKNEAKGHKGLESYTILPEKAAEFDKFVTFVASLVGLRTQISGLYPAPISCIVPTISSTLTL